MDATEGTYPVEIRWQGGRRARATSPDGLPALEIAPPPEFEGPGATWTPEHLLVAAVASCFVTTFLAIANRSRLEVETLGITAEGHLAKDADRRLWVDRVHLRPHIGVSEEADLARAERIAHKSEEVCLISRSLRTEVTLEPRVELAVRVPA